MTDSTEMPPIRKLLILAPNWLGDAIMMTPLLDLLAEASNYPKGETPQITLGIRDTWAPLFKNDGRIDKIIPLDRKGRHGGVRGLWALANLVQKENFDAVLLCPPSLRVGLVGWLARIPRRIGFASDGRSPLLTTALKKIPRGQKHFSQEMVSLGLVVLGRHEHSFSFHETTLNGCQEVSPTDLGEGPSVWVMAPGTTYGQAKTWPAKHVANFLDKAVSEHGVRVLLLGDNQSQAFVGQLQAACSSAWRTDFPGGAGIIDLTGKTSLMEVVALLKASSAFVGNDSGLMHLAGALGVPTLGLFGSSNPQWTAPLGRQTKALAVSGFSCQPCYRKTCNQEKFCLDNLPAEEVMMHLAKLLTEKV